MAADYKKEFPSQQPAEKIVFILHKHWATLLWPATKGLVALILAFTLPNIFNGWFYIFNSAIFTFIYLAWVIFWANYLIYEYLNWQRDKFIVTQNRIINIDQQSLFRRRVSELDLDQIQDIVHEVDGVIATTFNFGNVIISSADNDNIELHDIPNPAEIQSLLYKLVKEVSDDDPVTVEELIDFIQKQRKK